MTPEEVRINNLKPATHFIEVYKKFMFPEKNFQTPIRSMKWEHIIDSVLYPTVAIFKIRPIYKPTKN